MDFSYMLFLGLAAVTWGLHSRSRQTVEQLRTRIERLVRRIEHLERRVTSISKRSSLGGTLVEDSAVAVAPSQAPELPSNQQCSDSPDLAGEPDDAIPVPPPSPTEVNRPALDSKKAVEAESAARKKPNSTVPSVNWEQFMGVRLFAWLGGFALFLAAAFFVKYSFENNLISPELRVTIGFVTGAALLGGGTWMPRKTYRVTADTLCAVGVVILYAVTFTCHAIYAFPLFGSMVTFAGMSLITTVAFLLAVRLRAQVIAVLGMLGGFLTPILVSSSSANDVALFSYIAFLDLGLVAVSVSRRWGWLNVGAVFGTSIFQFLWMVEVFDSQEIPAALAIFLGFALLFLGAAVYARVRNRMNHWLAGAATVPALLTLVFVLLHLDRSLLGGRPEVLYAFLLVADLCLLGLAVLSARLRNLPVLGGGMTFLILAVWTLGVVETGMMYWALGGYVGFALLYTVFPIWARQRWREIPLSPYSHLFPAFALIMMLVPLFEFEVHSFFVWPFIMLLDVLAFGAAVALASVAGIVFALFITVGIAVAWFFHLPAEVFDVSRALGVIVGMVIVFEGGLVYALRAITARRLEASRGGSESSVPTWLQAFERLEAHLPALSAVLPFLLLILMTVQLPLDSPLPVYATALFLGGLLLAMTRFVAMRGLPAVGLVCTVLLQATWLGKGVDEATAHVSLYWAIGFYALYFLFPFLFLRGQADRWITWVAGVISGPAHFLLIHPLVLRYWPTDYPGLIPAAFVLPSVLGFGWLNRGLSEEHPKRLTILAWFGGVSLLFITLIFPIQFDREWLTLAWAFESAALLWLYRRVPHTGLQYTAIGLALVSFVRLTLNGAVFGYFPASSTPILNGFLYTYGLAALALVLGARFVRPPNHLINGRDMRGILIGMATILVFLLVNIEIADFFREPDQDRVRIQFGVHFAQDVAYTIAWGLFSLLLLVGGILRGLRVARYAGIGLMALTLLKLFFHDLASLSQLYRVGALVGVAVIAMMASLLYQRFFSGQREEIESNGKEDPMED